MNRPADRKIPLRLLAAGARAFGYGGAALAIMAASLAALNVAPIPALQAIWTGAVGNPDIGYASSLTATLTKTAPLLLTGLGVVVAWRAGMFSIGAEGQLLMGALTATALSVVGGRLPAPLLVGLMLVGAALAGAAWSAIAGWLRVRRNVPEVISTIMLNYIALNVVGWMVTAPGPLHGKTQSGPHSDPLPDTVALPNLFPHAPAGVQIHLHLGVALALAAAPLIWFYLFRTRSGFQIRVVGQNAVAARTARIPIDRRRMEAMIVSGALCGFAGAVELLGVTGRLGRDFSPGWGYTAIPAALLGGLSPIGTLFSAIFFGALAAGCSNAQRTAGVPSVVAYVIQAATVLAIVAARAWRNRRSGTEVD